MPKNIIFCADGTWNGPNSGEDDDTPKATNVWKLFLNLASDLHSGAWSTQRNKNRR
ncbi:DUF2235 domain-containing protein [Burkholderia sp. Leaf177]|uniref:DUF2235 domain-containing protein n=1 Tax=Burkholderia sp. Leaf177 TaxID=1736287 RepID=UPI000A44A773|nr:DUF2235 domain-containing protein [Burkholderia sp. Leaf177]